MKISEMGNAFLVEGPFGPSDHAHFREIPGRKRWHNQKLYVEDSLPNRQWLHENYPDKVAAPKVRPPEASAFRFKTPPYKHQMEAFGRMNLKPNFGLFCEQGTGKTKMLIDDMARLWAEGEIHSAVIIAPNGVHHQWIKEQIPEHMPDFVKYDCWDWVSGGKEPKGWWESENLRILAMNYEAAITKRGFEVLSILAHTKPTKTLCILDESHNIKSPSAKRSKSLVKLSDGFKYKRIASGTPITQGLEDLYMQFRFLDWTIIGNSSYYGYCNTFCVQVPIMGAPPGAKQIVGYQNQDILHDRIRPYTYTVQKADCLDLPPKVFSNHWVEMTTEQNRAYKTMKEDLIAQLEDGSIVEINQALTAIMKLQQITSGFLIDTENQVTHELKNNRLDALMSILEELDTSIIWCRFRYDAERIARRLGDASRLYIGGLGDKEKEKALSDCRSGVARWLVANPASAGTGLNLASFTNNAVYYSRSFNAAERWQSEDRIHRIGQDKSCFYTDLICPDTVDHGVLLSLQNKKSISDFTLSEIKSLILG